MPTFTDTSWSTPESNLTAQQFCAVCLVDTNPSGQDKIKARCKLPIRSRPGGAINKSALRNAAGRIFQMTGVQAEDKRKAARRLVSLMRQAKIEVSSKALLRLAGRRT